MTTEELLQVFPGKRIQPSDGMAVTATVWGEAHDYHRRYGHFHNLVGHGPGILAGLEVIASDPADSAIYIMPGVAIGAGGEFIVLREAVAYDVGGASGTLCLRLTYGEGSPRVSKSPDETAEILYVHSEFGVEAGQDLEGGAGVELARVRRETRKAAISNAQDPEHPGNNEIDLRFRREIGALSRSREVISMAVCYLGGRRSERHLRGASGLGRAVRHTGDLSLWVDDSVSLGPGLESYGLVYLVGLGAFTLDQDEVDVLKAYLQQGGTLFAESCRQKSAGEQPPADAAFSDLMDSLKVSLEEVKAGHALLTEPYLFAAATAGFVTQGKPKLLAGDGVVFSSHDYGCLWQGEQHGGAPSREVVRAAHEWGHNLVAYALRRRRESRAGQR